MSRHYMMLMDAATGPRLVGMSYYREMCQSCLRTDVDKLRMLADARIVTTTEFGAIRYKWKQEKLQEKRSHPPAHSRKRESNPKCLFCGSELGEGSRRYYCPPPKNCRRKNVYEKNFKSLGLWRGPNRIQPRIEDLKKWLREAV